MGTPVLNRRRKVCRRARSGKSFCLRLTKSPLQTLHKQMVRSYRLRSPEEEAALKLAEAEFERVQREEPVSVENIQEMLKELQSVADPKDPRIAIVSLRLSQEYEARGEDPKTFLKLGEQALSIFKLAGEFSVESCNLVTKSLTLGIPNYGMQERMMIHVRCMLLRTGPSPRKVWFLDFKIAAGFTWKTLLIEHCSSYHGSVRSNVHACVMKIDFPCPI
ncbi:hypothetical protein M758_3G193000 [Ceratodon purpureus]|nr:hypothetical protein M758_3G193000 [Ceratodon purpureus]